MIIKIKENVVNKRKNVKKGFHKFKDEVKSFFKEKGKMKKIKKWLFALYKYCLKHNVFVILLLALPFIIMDLATRIFGYDVNFYNLFKISPRLFSVAYIILILGVSLNTKKKYGKLLYSLIFIIFFILYLVQSIYYSTMGNYFSFSIMALAGEGSDYFLDAIKNTNILVYLVAILIIVIFVFGLRKYPKKTIYNRKKIIKVSIIFLILHIVSKLFLGSANVELTWDTWKNPRNVYNNFNDSNKCFSIAGLYEYTIRDFYVNYLKPEEKKSDMENNFLSEIFSEKNDNYNKNKYTGKFKGKNVIFLQLEGIDDWILTKDIMPNTYKLMDNSINFKKHYSFYTGGGSTFNSEFMINTGYTTPFTYPMNAYTLNKNDFPYSMANLMKQYDYGVKAFHMNSKEYYSRGINYYNWGYDSYLGLKDLNDYSDNTYQLDTELILNQTFYDEIFKNTGKFINYIISYSNHLPFDSSKGVCNQLLRKDYKKQLEKLDADEQKDFIKNLNYTEEDCIKRQAKETDDMVGLLIKGLKDNGLYNNTILFVYGDHYLYTVSDKEILKEHGKDIDTNLINHTPLFIWSNGMKKEDINKVTTPLNILPTFLNLMGVSYNEKWFLGEDVFSKNYKPIAIFPDMSWYDGTYYVENGEVKNNKKISSNLLEEKNSYADYLVKKNDLVLKYNYFKEIAN